MNDSEIKDTDLEECPLCAIIHIPNAETIKALESKEYSRVFNNLDDFFAELGI